VKSCRSFGRCDLGGGRLFGAGKPQFVVVDEFVDGAPGDTCQGETGTNEDLLVSLLDQAVGEQITGRDGKCVSEIAE